MRLSNLIAKAENMSLRVGKAFKAGGKAMVADFKTPEKKTEPIVNTESEHKQD
jgi:hypothetical protein